ncbi:MAG: hypothetical protein HZA88_21965 [Verrucomicrobia bacterium]|nr:hypothetical protein [Verrucomicrobiota bacterium]
MTIWRKCADNRAEQAFAQKLSDEEVATVEASMQKAITLIEVKRRHRGQHSARSQHSHQKQAQSLLAECRDQFALRERSFVEFTSLLFPADRIRLGPSMTRHVIDFCEWMTVVRNKTLESKWKTRKETSVFQLVFRGPPV